MDRRIVVLSLLVYLGGVAFPCTAGAQAPPNGQLVFAPETQPNARGITGYYKLPASMHRPVEDGFEFELLTAPDGEIGFQKRTSATATQKQSLPNGRFNPRHIIIGKPPFPELEGAKVAAGEPPRELLAQAPLIVPSEAAPAQAKDATTYQQLGSSFDIVFTYGSDGNSTLHGNAVLPHPDARGSPLRKPPGVNHQWVSLDFVATNYFSDAAGQTALAHMPIMLYRWSQLDSWRIPPPGKSNAAVDHVGYNSWVGIGAFFGDNSASSVGCGNSDPGSPAHGKPKDNATVERFSRIRDYKDEPFYGEGYVSPHGCGSHSLLNNRLYRFIVQGSDGGWAAYHLYLKILDTWYQVAEYYEHR